MIYVHDRGRKTGRQTETRSVNETTNHFHAYYTHFCFKETAERKNCTKLLQTVTQVLENKDLLGEIAYRSLDEFVCAYMFSRFTICSCSFWLGHTYAAANLCM